MNLKNTSLKLVIFFFSLSALHSERVGTLLEPARVPILVNGKEAGASTSAAGTKVKIVREEGGKTLIATSVGHTWVESSKVYQGDGPAPIPVKPTPAPIATPAPKAMPVLKATPAPAQRPTRAATESISEEIDLPEKPTDDEVPDFLPTTAKHVDANAEIPKKRVLVIPPSAQWGGTTTTHWQLAIGLKEQGSEVTVLDWQPREWKSDDIRAPFAQDKWIKQRDELNLAEYDVVVSSMVGNSQPDNLVCKANNLGKLVIIGQYAGPWVFESDKKEAEAVETSYLRDQVEKGYLTKCLGNQSWEKSPLFDRNATGSASVSGADKKSLMRSGDVIAWKNLVCYNISPTGINTFRGQKYHPANGYQWDHGKGWEGMGGYNSKSTEKFVSTALLPAVLEAIRTHKEEPKDMTPPKLTRASYLPQRATLPLAIPPTRPKTEGKVVMWGKTSFGGNPTPDAGKELQPPDKLRAVHVACGYDPVCIALKANGTVVAWGENKSGLCDVPAGLTNVVQVAIADLAAALKDDGTVVTWGKEAKPLPAEISNVVQIAIAGSTVYCLKSDGTLAGVSKSKRFIPPANLVQIIGGRYPLGLTQDGKVVPLADIRENDFDIPQDLGEVSALADCNNTQAQHIAVLFVDGTVGAWGRNDSGQATVPDGMNDVIQVASGDSNTFIIKRDGKVQGWGNNWMGQLEIPKGLSQVVQVSAGAGVCFAITKD